MKYWLILVTMTSNEATYCLITEDGVDWKVE